jgi:hypothetical protein
MTNFDDCHLNKMAVIRSVPRERDATGSVVGVGMILRKLRISTSPRELPFPRGCLGANVRPSLAEPRAVLAAMRGQSAAT